MSVQLDDAKLAAPCGLYCGVCPVSMASSNNALAEKLAQTMGLPPERIKCLGCKTERGT
ncbi:MAG: DUF3795 domain-containing protein [Dehalococcoidia bacterium]|nr:MAG: DUF3795 domain-containing protein [Dehalococcoidia bacterium]